MLCRLVYLKKQQREQSNIPNKSQEQTDLPNESLEYLLAVMKAILLYVKREVIGISLLCQTLIISFSSYVSIRLSTRLSKGRLESLRQLAGNSTCCGASSETGSTSSSVVERTAIVTLVFAGATKRRSTRKVTKATDAMYTPGIHSLGSWAIPSESASFV